MKIPEKAERTKMIIQGIAVAVPVLVTPETLKASAKAFEALAIPVDAAASILQQTLQENIRNNTASSVSAIIDKVLKANDVQDWSGKISDLDDDTKALISANIDVTEVQKVVDKYVEDYTPGVRRVSSEEPMDPVEVQARRLAKLAVQDNLEETPFTWEGVSYTGIGRTARADSYKAFDARCKAKLGIAASDFIEQKVEHYVETMPYFREQAALELKKHKEAVSKLSLSIDG